MPRTTRSQTRARILAENPAPPPPAHLSPATQRPSPHPSSPATENYLLTHDLEMYHLLSTSPPPASTRTTIPLPSAGPTWTPPPAPTSPEELGTTLGICYRDLQQTTSALIRSLHETHELLERQMVGVDEKTGELNKSAQGELREKLNKAAGVFLRVGADIVACLELQEHDGLGGVDGDVSSSEARTEEEDDADLPPGV